ncbi:MAG: hypothetical protein A3F14_03755 [Gammaproteobacteria bacterium RIFCSPHIGHO2_12_FULL_43_28]|nr:MAG: hypothetical protein A3F14_03755 [Gammaproteobacteria bacterium RIFCSPHIGHO2_12_FULL_43_28]
MKLLHMVFISGLAINVTLFSKDMYAPSMPAIAGTLHLSNAYVQSSFSTFLIGMVLSQLLFGVASDFYGRKKIMLMGLFLCLFGNFLSMIAHTGANFLLSRLIVGLGAGAAPVVTRAMATDLYKGNELTKVIAYLSMITVFSPVIAPVLGGYLQINYIWQTNFMFLTFFSGVTWLLIMTYCRETQKSRIQSNENKLHYTIQNYINMLRNQTFIAYGLISAIAFSSGVIYFVMSPFIFQNVLHLTALQNGYLYIFVGLGYFVGALLASKLVVRFSDDTVIMLGILLCLASAFLMMALFVLSGVTLTAIVLPMFINVVGCGLITPPASKQGITLFLDMAGSAAALIGVMRMFVALLVTLVVTIAPSHNQLALAYLLMILASVALLAIMLVRARAVNIETASL